MTRLIEIEYGDSKADAAGERHLKILCLERLSPVHARSVHRFIT